MSRKMIIKEYEAKRTSQLKKKQIIRPVLALMLTLLIGTGVILSVPIVQAANISVTTLLDENDGCNVGAGCSLREAIAAATPGQEIDFSVTGIITLTNGQLSIDKNLIITGPGADHLTIVATAVQGVWPSSRIFHILNGAEVEINDVTISKGTAPFVNRPDDRIIGGNGVLNEGTLTLGNCVVSHNGAHTLDGGAPGQSGTDGGYNGGAGEDGSGGMPGPYNGGGILNTGMLTLTNCIISNNMAATGAPGGSGGNGGFGLVSGGAGGQGGQGGDGAYGGGIFNSGTLTMISSTVSSNQAGPGGPGGSGGNGGDGGDAIEGVTGDGGNGGHASQGGLAGQGGHGGGIYNTGTATLINSAVSNNHAGSGGSGGDGGDGGDGGRGVYSPLTCVGGRGGNGGRGGGGSDNSGNGRGRGGDGGGIFNTNTGKLTLINSTISGNKNGRGGSGGSSGNGGNGNDGGFGGSCPDPEQGQGGSGGGGPSGGSGGNPGNGGALYNKGELSMTNVTITANDNGRVGSGGSGGIGGSEGYPPSPSGPGGDGATGSDGYMFGIGGIITDQGVVTTVRNSIIAGNVKLPNGSEGNCGGFNIPAHTDAYDYNLMGWDCPDGGNHHIRENNPNLSPLEDNGGPTKTHAPLSDSPAIDAGSCTDATGNSITQDQRGNIRPAGSTCDMGAYEYGAINPNGDTDGDGLLDGWESNGIDFDKDGAIDLELYDVNGDGTIQANEQADPDHKDIYLEIDWMAQHQPTTAALNAVIASFANAPVSNPDGTTGIRLHILSDAQVMAHNDLFAFEPCTNAAQSGISDFDGVKAANFGSAAERADGNSANILAAKRLVFRYMLFAHNLLGKGGTSGCAELPGNDFVVSLGWYNKKGDHVSGNSDQQAGTLMHELGHTLDLRHGGSDNNNCKPNYLSIMSYTRQFDHHIPNRPLDYSHSLLPTLNESNLNETIGISGSSGDFTAFGPPPIKANITADGSIDWNGDGNLTSGVSSDLNNFGIKGCNGSGETISGYDDWSNLLYNFRNSSDFADGAHLTILENEEVDLDDLEAISLDSDDDGFVNIKDNCPYVSNPNQEDTDGDGDGDVCSSSTTTNVYLPIILK